MIHSLLQQTITYKSLIIFITIMFVPIIVLMFDAGIFWGLIGIAMAIVSVGFPSYWTYRNRSNSLTNATNFLRKIILGLIDEKIAMLGGYIAEVPE
jgi:hypothetical protein